ncbi:MAG: DUF1294 domain-containing protein [Hyphomicrobiales bacterium]|nr:MAG: DUF1294 domain-containing protein [Hyphomicrobiales bacterium]
MRETGELVEWNDERGFGFVRPATGDKLFVHIKAFGPVQRRPAIGDRLVFSRGPGRDGRPAVIAAKIAGLPPRPSTGPPTERIEGAQRSRMLRIAAAAGLLAALLFVRSTGVLPGWALWVYLAMSIASALAYWNDKRAANAGGWRVSERQLHTLDLAFGIIGGLLAQAALRHKTAKPNFALITWAIAVLHLIGLGLVWAGLPAIAIG